MGSILIKISKTAVINSPHFPRNLIFISGKFKNTSLRVMFELSAKCPNKSWSLSLWLPLHTNWDQSQMVNSTIERSAQLHLFPWSTETFSAQPTIKSNATKIWNRHLFSKPLQISRLIFHFPFRKKLGGFEQCLRVLLSMSPTEYRLEWIPLWEPQNVLFWLQSVMKTKPDSCCSRQYGLCRIGWMGDWKLYNPATKG